ncbi:hypothetical protein ACTL6U_09400 [Rhodovibrionaceae bacterium A322]
MLKHLALAMTLPLVLALAGCGSSSTVTEEHSTATLGQELEDLQKAYESGAMTKDEYEKLREHLVNKN